MKSMLEKFKGGGVQSRALRGTFMTIVDVVGSNALRMLSNIALTRILYPEALGVMSLAFMFIYGLQTFSDIGIRTSIVQNKFGEDRRFLDTAWTLQLIRGLILWAGSFALAFPAASIYEQENLLYILPTIGFIAVIDGLQTTAVAQADRNLNLVRQTMLKMSAQVASIFVTILLSLAFRSEWGLALGAVFGAAAKVVFFQVGMKAPRNSFCWDKKYFHEIIGFGKYIFFATIATYFANTSGTAILGLYFDTAVLGIASIGFLIGTAPSLVANAIGAKILFPLYRMKSPLESEENRNKVNKARRLVSLLAIGAGTFLAFFGPYIVNFLYDERYVQAGAMITLVSLRAIPGHSFLGTQNILLAQGDGQRYFVYMFCMAISITTLTWFGITTAGIAGAILAYGVANFLVYPLRVVMIARYSAWDAKGELLSLSYGLLLTGAACYFHLTEVRALFLIPQ